MISSSPSLIGEPPAGCSVPIAGCVIRPVAACNPVQSATSKISSPCIDFVPSVSWQIMIVSHCLRTTWRQGMNKRLRTEGLPVNVKPEARLAFAPRGDNDHSVRFERAESADEHSPCRLIGIVGPTRVSTAIRAVPTARAWRSESMQCVAFPARRSATVPTVRILLEATTRPMLHICVLRVKGEPDAIPCKFAATIRRGFRRRHRWNCSRLLTPTRFASKPDVARCASGRARE